MTTTGKTESATGAMPFPVIQDGIIGSQTVQTVNARDVHTYLKVGKDFSTWIKERIGTFGFVEGEDFVSYENLSSPNSGSAKSRAQTTIEYALSLDMGKELGMVDRSPQGRTIRQYFLACERMLKAEVRKQADIDALVDRRISAVLAERTLMIRHGSTAGQIYRSAGFPPMKGMAAWFSNRLREMECSVPGEAKSEQGGRTARMFDPDKASRWLERNGGRLAVEDKLARRRGQPVQIGLHLVQPIAPQKTDIQTATSAG